MCNINNFLKAMNWKGTGGQEREWREGKYFLNKSQKIYDVNIVHTYEIKNKFNKQETT